MKPLKRIFITLVFLSFFLPDCRATCYKITKVNTTPANNSYTEPGKGDVVNWAGTTDSSGSAGSIAGNINFPTNTILFDHSGFLPNGSLLASGTVRFTEMGSIAYTPDTILFRCTADEEGKLYEFYSTNGDNAYSGKIMVESNAGQSESYQTYFTEVASRITNLVTGEYYSRYWKSRPLLNLDRDSYGWILVKAKNFSDAKIELFKNLHADGGVASGKYGYSQPLAYIAFQGGGLSARLYNGADHLSNTDGWYKYWPGAINLYNRVSLTKINTCKLTQTTPIVNFKSISAQRLMQGQKVAQPIDINFVCQSTTSSDGYTGFRSGVDPNQTGIGFVINAENAAAARQEGLEIYSHQYSHLLSDGYKIHPDAPTGVGIVITNGIDDYTFELFDDINTPGGKTSPWRPVLMESRPAGMDNTLQSYTARYYATLERLPGKEVTPGYFHATMQVVVKVL